MDLNLEKIPKQEASQTEKDPNLENKREKKVESRDREDKKIEAIKTDISQKKSSKEKEISNEKLQRAQEIDQILALGLNNIFLSLSPQKQEEFKKKGEETVFKINNLLDKAKVNIEKIVKLIRNWLKIIPGVNKFFLEQEAKIKADNIIKLKK